MKRMLWGGLLCSCTTLAMGLQPINENALRQESAQAGLTLQVSPASSTLGAGSFGLQQLAIRDTDGMPAISQLSVSGSSSSTPYTAPAVNTLHFTSGGGIRFLTAAGAATSAPIIFNGDADGGTGGNQPVLLLSAQLPADLRRLQLDIAGLSLASSFSGAATASRWLQFGNGIRLNFDAAPQFSLRLGNQIAGSASMMVNISSLALSSVDLGTVHVASTGGSASEGSLSMSAQATGINLSGGGFNVDSSGLNYQQGQVANMGISANTVTMGQAGIASSRFSGFTNAPIGSAGITNMTLTNAFLKAGGL